MHFGIPFFREIEDEAGHPDFGTAFDNFIHLSGATDSLGEGNMIEWLIIKTGNCCDESFDRRIGNCLDDCAIFQSAAIDSVEGITGLGAENLVKMFGLLGGQYESVLDNILGVNEKICNCDFDGLAFLVCIHYSVRS